MKLINDDEVVLGSAGKKTKFTIQASPKAFVILSDKLYKNKIRAVVRELTTNWLDAHILNNNQHVPAEIKCPNRLDPRFIIRDFGPGMSDFDIRGDDENPGLYNSYFASTKAESNDFIGALGLGSKSPFSYTKSFTIVSYFEGEARGYMAVMNNGEPDIRPLFVEPMKEGERTGIEITVPVKAEDVDKFAYEIAYIMRPMAVQPIITGASITVDQFPQDVEWFSSPNGFGKDPRGLYAVYGRIVYPIDTFEGLQYEWLLNRYGSVYINFPLGDLDITPSREELSLDEITLTNIKEKVNTLEQTTLEKDIEKFETIENKRELVRQLVDLNSTQRQILNKRAVKFQGKTHAEWMNFFKPDELVKHIENSNMASYRVEIETKRMRLTSSWGSRAKVSASNLLNHGNKSVYMMIDDKAQRRAATFRGMYLKDMYKYATFIMIDPNNPEHLDIMEKIKVLFTGDEVVILKASDLEEVRKFEKDTYSAKDPDDKPRPKSPNGQRHYIEDGYWREEDLFMTKSEVLELEGYAIQRSRDDMSTFPEGLHWSIGIDSIKGLAFSIGITEFYVIRPSSIKHASENPNLESLARVIVDTYIELIDEIPADEYVPYKFYNKRMIAHLKNKKEISWILSKITGNDNTMRVALLNDIGRTLTSVSITKTEDTEIGKDLALCNLIYNKLTDSASKGLELEIAKFELDYPVVAYMLNEYHLEDSHVQDISRIMKALKDAPPLKGKDNE